MPAYVAKRLVQMLIQKGKNPGQCRVLVLGITFKENVADIRNSKVADLVRELQQFSITTHLVDPFASAAEVAHEYNLVLMSEPEENYDAVIIAVAHQQFVEMNLESLRKLMNGTPLMLDLKGIHSRKAADDLNIAYWRL
jgi:UDP-N-acetyl-D-galactosamine dehydrogenase